MAIAALATGGTDEGDGKFWNRRPFLLVGRFSVQEGNFRRGGKFQIKKCWKRRHVPWAARAHATPLVPNTLDPPLIRMNLEWRISHEQEAAKVQAMPLKQTTQGMV